MENLQPMKALTLWQPYASLVAIGAKGIETRSWTTSYRGPLAIHAAKRTPLWAWQNAGLSPFRDALEQAGLDWRQLPSGVIVATCWLDSIYRITETTAQGLGEHELAFGDLAPGRYAWWLDRVHRLPEPIPAVGRQGLWDWTPSEGQAIES